MLKFHSIRLVLAAGIAAFTCFIQLEAQNDEDALFIKSIHDHALESGECYNWLTYLSEGIGGRLAGSAESYEAIDYTKSILETLSDTAYLQECHVPHWERGSQEVVEIVLADGTRRNIGGLALGNSISTPSKGLQAPIVMVQSLEEVKELGRSQIEGKIVFYNRPLDPTLVNTFYAYGRGGDQRVNGPATASEYGAVGTLVRSLTLSLDDVPHTGVTRYKDEHPKIPAVAISTMDAEYLSDLLKGSNNVEAYIKTDAKMLDDAKLSYNVIGEIRGSEYPEEIILVGGHLDSWDVGGGAHDDGSGCVHSMQVLATLVALDYQPKRTIRCVMFMNEENGLGGGLAYAKASNQNGEQHIAAIESDAGGFSPNGFSCDAEDEVFAELFRQVDGWEDLLAPYHLRIDKGGSGADINPLKSQGGLLMGLRPNSQRYFDFHHTANDRIDAVHERELKLGAAAMTSMVFLLDKYGLNKK